MKLSIFLVISTCLFYTGFNRKHGQQIEQLKSDDTIKIFTRGRAESSAITRNTFDQDLPFEIISSSRGITKQSSATDTNMCIGWNIPKRKLYTVIKDSKIVSGTEWDLYFDVLPCVIRGKLKQKGEIFNYELNGGSWMYIRSSDTTVILGNYNKEDRKYFISGAMPD